MAFTPEQLLILTHHRGSAAETARAIGIPRQHVNDLLRGAKLRRAIVEKGFPIKRDPSMTVSPPSGPPRAHEGTSGQKSPAPVAASASVAPVATAGAPMSVEEVVAALSAIGRDESSGDRLKAIDLLQKIRSNTPDAASTDKEIKEASAKQKRALAEQRREEQNVAMELAYRLSFAFATRRYVALARCEFIGEAVEKGEEIEIEQIKPDSKFFREAPAQESDFDVKETPAKPLPSKEAPNFLS